MKHILVPFHKTKASLKALEYAAMLSIGEDTTVTALHLVDQDQYTSKEAFDFDIKKITELEVRPMLIEASKINPNLKKIKLQVMAKEEEISAHILDFAKDNEVDFIVMNSHGLPESDMWEHQLEDTIAYQVVLEARCPVFTFTQEPKTKKLAKIILPLDLTGGSMKKVPLAVQMAKQFKASLHIFSVVEDLDSKEADKIREMQKEVLDLAKNKRIEASKIIIEADELFVPLMEFGESIAADLIVIMNRPKALWDDLFVAPGAKRIISFSRTPVLSLRGRDRHTTA